MRNGESIRASPGLSRGGGIAERWDGVRPKQAQAERVLQRPPQAFDQRDCVGVLPSSERNARAFISARAFKPRLTLIGS
jgi:hypothetical protein